MVWQRFAKPWPLLGLRVRLSHPPPVQKVLLRGLQLVLKTRVSERTGVRLLYLLPYALVEVGGELREPVKLE